MAQPNCGLSTEAEAQKSLRQNTSCIWGIYSCNILYKFNKYFGLKKINTNW